MSAGQRFAACFALGMLSTASAEGIPAAQGVWGFDVLRSGNAIHVLIGDAHGGKASLWHSRSHDGGYRWTPSVRVDAGLASPRLSMTDNDAQLIQSGAELIAVWSAADTGSGRNSGLASAVSSDAGRTWRRNRAAGRPTGESGTVSVPGLYPGTVHGLVRTGSDGAAELRYVASADSGKTWWIAFTLASGPVGKFDLTRAADGMLAAIWDQAEGTQSEIRYALSLDDGRSWGAAQRLSSGGTGNAIRPRVIPTEDGFLGLWLESWRGGEQVFQRKVIEVQHRQHPPAAPQAQQPHKGH